MTLPAASDDRRSVYSCPGRFDGRTAIVTGGSSGIGLATARRLLAEGAQAVTLLGRDPARGAAALQALSDQRVRFQTLDVADAAAVATVIDDAVGRLGRLDLLVNAAGTVVFGPVRDLKPAHWQRIVGINLNGVFHCCSAALPHLVRTAAQSGDPTSTAAIVNVASISASGGDRGMAAYNAAKAGVLNFSRSLALEVAGDRVRVNTVSPGPVDTPLAAMTAQDPDLAQYYDAFIPLGRFGRPAEVAAAIAFLGAPEAGFITGAELLVDGGLSARSGLPDLVRIMADRARNTGEGTQG